MVGSSTSSSRSEMWVRLEEEVQSLHGDVKTDDSQSLRQTVRDLLERPESSTAALAVHYFIIVVILGATAVAIIETVPQLSKFSFAFLVVDAIVTVVFTIEFGLRVWTAESCSSFVLDMCTVTDLVALLPGYLIMQTAWTRHEPDLGGFYPVSTLRNLRIWRLMRCVRLLRLFRVWSYAKEVWLLFRVINEVSDTSLSAVFSALVFFAIISASCLYVVESCVDYKEQSELANRGSLIGGVHINLENIPEQTVGSMSRFDDVPSCLWFSLITLTTVGYGDTIPATVWGRIVGGLTCAVGLAVIATASGFLSMHFRDHFVRENAKAVFAQHFADSPTLAKEKDEIEGLVSDVRKSADALLVKLASTSLRFEEEEARSSMMPLLQSVNASAVALVNEIYAFMYDVLFEAMLLRGERGRRSLQ
eukprot:TRINITY_DN57178_c0_g1_i1.p1 TRINITY_DN57178_c0_g1~~TRINITY_DN57178_c0_g1_i1.p1  ORF type:complete len:419 (-),score=79.38 TRINITY_DN57178_c0_g1_i1:70-1326(-)